jgi:hypothetical protein
MSSEGNAHDCKERDIDFTISSGNVFADLVFAEPDTELVHINPKRFGELREDLRAILEP